MERITNFGIRKTGIILGLLSNVQLAARVAKAAKDFGLMVHNSDKAETIVLHAKRERPLLVILDWEGCEAEAFKLLNEFRQDADLKKVPVVGTLLKEQEDLRREAVAGGCDRVYTKTEFLKVLNDLFVRYTQ